MGAGATGLEPATSGVTGRRSNQLSYAPVRPTVWQPVPDRKGGPTTDRQTARRTTATGRGRRVFARRQPYSQEVGPVPKCKTRCRRVSPRRCGVGCLAATAVAATIDGDDGPNRLRGTVDADVIQAFGGNDRVLALAGDDQVVAGTGNDRRPRRRRRRQRQRPGRLRPPLRRRRQRRAAGLGRPGPPVGRVRRRHADRRRARGGRPDQPRPPVGRPRRRHAARRRRPRPAPRRRRTTTRPSARTAAT